jgi:DNA-damage-inducible protein J
MPTNAVVRARIDENIKERAAAVLSTMGLTVSDAVRMMLTRIARDEALPFDLTPNALTAETLRKSEMGEDVHHVNDAGALFKDLDI